MLNETSAVREMREFIRQKAARRKDRNMRNWRRAAEDAARIISMITREFDPLAVYQWGSVLNAEHFSEISDIDIAVAGLDSAEAFFALVARAEELTDFPLDIVQLEHVEPEYANLIRTYGRCVYMRDGQSLESP